MAVLAVHAALVGQIVVELGPLRPARSPCPDLVAAGAGSVRPFVEEIVLEMAEETGRGGHRHVGSLHDLAMAARAAQLLAPAQILQVRQMIEGYALKVDAPG